VSAEYWTSTRPTPGVSRDFARRTEQEGWTGLCFADTQNLSGDPYVGLAVAALVTEDLRLGIGVTNPWTRHPVVTASAIESAYLESGGRVELGIGRGDSSLAYLGLAPAPLSQLRDYVEIVRTYLRGDGVPMSRVTGAAAHTLGKHFPLGTAPSESRLKWLPRDAAEAPVPVWIAASGPKVISTAAEIADRVTLAVGADPVRLRWAIRTARSVRADVKIAAYVNVVVNEDPERARELGAGTIASFTRFGGMHGTMYGEASPGQREVFETLPATYDMNRHFGSGEQAQLVSDEFASRFAILGPASYCRERLLELEEMGIDRFHVIGATPDLDSEVVLESNLKFVHAVLTQ
jgi:5,10-methylenetetrahydromethanopterin reductase